MRYVILAIPVVLLLGAPIMFPTAGMVLAALLLGYCGGAFMALAVLNAK